MVKILKILLYLEIFLISLTFISAFEFNGTVFDINGTRMFNATVNVTVRSTTDFSVVGYNFTRTNTSGWFNLTVEENANWMYEPVIFYYNTTYNYTAYIGQNLPAFPQQIFSQLSDTKFYLRYAGTINLTAINVSNSRIGFNYQIKDTKLGYPIADSFGSTKTVMEANIIVPSDRNYSITIYPNRSMPISFDWNNFSSSGSYRILTNAVGNISSYNITTKTLHKQFNDSVSLPSVTGFVNFSRVAGWDYLRVVPYMLEPGNMVHATYGDMLYNMSAFQGGTDIFNTTAGNYSITLPAPTESGNFILFVTAINGTNYYGGFANVTLTYGATIGQVNITLYGLLGAHANITMDNAGNFSTDFKEPNSILPLPEIQINFLLEL